MIFRYDKSHGAIFYFSHLRHMLWLFLSLFFASITISAKDIHTTPPKAWFDKIQTAQAHLNKQRQTLLEADGADAQTLRQWQTLAERFIFTKEVKSELDQSLQKAQLLINHNKNSDANALLAEITTRYQKMSDEFTLIGKSIEAEKRAEQTRKDSKMYFMMRVRSQLPQKTLKAYGIMALATQKRDQGEFAEALSLWDQAEIMVRESFDEHIADMAEWREQAKRHEKIKEAQIHGKVKTLLADYFVEIPAGSFLMGSDSDSPDEAPRHKVSVPAFRIGKSEVTFELYDLCVESTRCYALPDDQGWGRGDRPVTNVSYRDITQQFLPWLNAITERQYRLPSEAEWEYVVRARSETEYAWGDNITCSMARFNGGGTSICSARNIENRGTAPVMSYKPNAFGVYDMHGNVWEWVEDCWNANYQNAPTDGRPWHDGNCNVRVLRGGSWDYHKSGLRSANRYYFSQKIRRPNYGFRLAESHTLNFIED